MVWLKENQDEFLIFNFYISNSKRYTTRHTAERRIQNAAHSVLHNSINVRNYDIILIYAFI